MSQNIREAIAYFLLAATAISIAVTLRRNGRGR